MKGGAAKQWAGAKQSHAPLRTYFISSGWWKLQSHFNQLFATLHWEWLLCRDDFFKQYCQDQSAEELYEQIDLLNRNLVGGQQQQQHLQ